MAAVRPSLALLRNKAWIGGKWTSAINESTFPVYNPSTGQKIADIPDMGEEDMEKAIREAHESQKTWSATLAKERAQLLKKFHEVVMANQQDLASIVSLEMGKPLVESLGEVAYGASYLEWFAEEAKRVYGDVIATPFRGRRNIVIKQPIGVSALVTPWNFPVAMVLRKVGAALAAGCTCISKPSEETPLSAFALAELSHQAKLPPGVFNVVSSSRENSPLLGEKICHSDLIRKVSFTGSTAVGKIFMSQCAQTVKRLSMELGGNAPLIVFNSADIDLAVKGTIATKFRNTGQTCISSNRILAQSGIYDQFIVALSEAVSRLKLGDAFQEGVNQGPLINMTGIKKVEGHVSDAVSKGAELTMGGGPDEALGELFYKPSVLAGVTTSMRIAHEETFGPVAPVIKFEEEEEAIAISNDTPFGLSSYIFSSDMSQIWRVGEALETGMVGVNEGAVSSEVIPFGGIKQSGFGREGSKYGINEYLSLKYLCIGGVAEREVKQ